MGFLNRCRYTYKIKTVIHLIRRVKSLSFSAFSSKEFDFFLCDSQNGNNEYVREFKSGK